jgi:cell fate regulator YaaT (PSP1 superfamily)
MTAQDVSAQTRLQTSARSAFLDWVARVRQWDLDLQLIDLEWTHDERKLILYVLNERGAECTRLALQAAAAGYSVEVQPVSAEGLVALPTGGTGCHACGCHGD